MSTLLRLMGGGWIVFGFSTTTVPESAAQVPYRYQYAAKVVCSSRETALRLGLPPQAYETTINIHNPSDDSVAVFRKKLALTVPPAGQRSGRVFELQGVVDRLGPDTALATNCADLRKRFSEAGPVFEGFVVIQSTRSLDVTAVYAVLGGIDVEVIPERVQP